MAKHIEVIVPCYNEQECIRPFYEELHKVFAGMENYTFSILFVDDGSTDNTLNEIRLLSVETGADVIRYVSFSRNFGKEAALYAGLSNCKGDLVAVMDVDLQHPPKLLMEMTAVLEEGYDCAGARRVSRKGEPFIRSMLSGCFYHVINAMTGMKLVPGMTDYRLMTDQVAAIIVSMQERERFTKGLYAWIGFRTKWIEYVNVERINGISKWSIRGLWNYARNGFIAFAVAPLRGVIYLGLIVVFVSFIYGLQVLTAAYGGARKWEDTTTIILLLLFLGGVVITTLGVIGEYLARIYLEAKHRPIYIEKCTNIKRNEKQESGSEQKKACESEIAR